MREKIATGRPFRLRVPAIAKSEASLSTSIGVSSIAKIADSMSFFIYSNAILAS